MIAKVTAALTLNEPESFKSTLTSSLTTDLNSSLESGMNLKIAALKTNFRTELGSNVVDLIYPVGSYYVSHSSTSPATLFPGTTWTQIESKFLYCMPASNAKKPENSNVALSVGGTGGSTTHTHTTGSHGLTVSEIPSHSHSFTGTTATGSFVVRHSTANNTGNVYYGEGVFTAERRSSESSSGNGIPCESNTAKDDLVSFSMTPNGSIGNTGSGGAHNHGDTSSTSSIPPYVAVYCWRRTA